MLTVYNLSLSCTPESHMCLYQELTRSVSDLERSFDLCYQLRDLVRVPLREGRLSYNRPLVLVYKQVTHGIGRVTTVATRCCLQSLLVIRFSSSDKLRQH